MRVRWTLLTLLCMAMTAAAQEYQLIWDEDFTDQQLDKQVWNIEVNGDGGAVKF